MVGEFVGSDKGLGYVIVSATSYWKSNLAFAAMLLLSVMAVGLFALVEVVERVVCPWYALAREQGEVVEELSVKELEKVRAAAGERPSARRGVPGAPGNGTCGRARECR